MDKLEQFFQIISRMCLEHKAEFDENCAHVTSVVPNVPPESTVQTQPVSALAVPFSINT